VRIVRLFVIHALVLAWIVATSGVAKANDPTLGLPVLRMTIQAVGVPATLVSESPPSSATATDRPLLSLLPPLPLPGLPLVPESYLQQQAQATSLSRPVQGSTAAAMEDPCASPFAAREFGYVSAHFNFCAVHPYILRVLRCAGTKCQELGRAGVYQGSWTGPST
jgi:hypothetical protein